MFKSARIQNWKEESISYLDPLSERIIETNMNCTSLGSCQKTLVERIWYCYKWFVPTFYVLIESLSDEKSLTSKNKFSCIFFKESFILHRRCDLFSIISISSINHYPAYRHPSHWVLRIKFLQFHSFFFNIYMKLHSFLLISSLYI